MERNYGSTNSTVKPSNGSPDVEPSLPGGTRWRVAEIEDFEMSKSIHTCDIQTMLQMCKINGDKHQFKRLVQGWVMVYVRQGMSLEEAIDLVNSESCFEIIIVEED